MGRPAIPADLGFALRPAGHNGAVKRVAALLCWAYLGWAVLSWTLTAEQVLVGLLVSTVVAVALAPLGPVLGPWHLLRPRVLLRLLRLGALAGSRMVVANVRLSARIWSPRRRLASGMVVVPTEAKTDGALTAVGLLTSVIVDNQLVDVDRVRHRLQYHAVDVRTRDPHQLRDQINGPVERLLDTDGANGAAR
jgi:multicomponent Na+:H+ antiporter subunit E